MDPQPYYEETYHTDKWPINETNALAISMMKRGRWQDNAELNATRRKRTVSTSCDVVVCVSENGEICALEVVSAFSSLVGTFGASLGKDQLL